MEETFNSRRSSARPTSKPAYDGNNFMIGLGYGNSYGGLGMRLQFRVGGKVGFGMHAGVGYFENAPVLVSGGIKFFPYKSLYLDVQFGMTGYERYYVYYYDYYDDYYDYGDSHILYGPSFLIGGDFTWGRRVGFGFNAAAGITYNINAEYYDPLTIALDLGFLIRF